jgi:abortive infection bacteriophage resistance protein
MGEIYSKKSKTIEEQLALLQQRGLIINDVNLAKQFLSHVSYYRISAYMLPFKPYKKFNNHLEKEKFASGAKFEDVVRLYNFDKKLRNAIFDIIEKVEISVRTNITYYLSNKYSSH